MPLYDPNRRQSIYLSDGHMALQRDEIPLLSREIHFELCSDWVFQVEIPSSCSQHLLHTWQRMIHEPTYSRPAAGYQEGGYQRTYTYEAACYETMNYPLAGKDYSQSGRQRCQVIGARVAFVGNNERGQRRVVYLEGIRQLEITVDSLSLDSSIICFRCDASFGLEAILYVNDGCNLNHDIG